MRRVLMIGLVLSVFLSINTVWGSEITGIARDEISLKAGPTAPGEKIPMVWLEALVYPKTLKKDRVISLGVRLTTPVEKVVTSFDFGNDKVALTSDDGLYWSGAYELPAGISAGLHVARYNIANKKGSIQRTVEFFVEKPSYRADAREGEIYRAQGWPLTVASTCSALVDGSSRVLYKGQKVIGLSKVSWYKVIFEDGEIGYVSALKVEEPLQQYFQLGWEAYHDKKYSNAISYFRDTVAIDPKFEKGYFWLAKANYKLGKLDDSFRAINKAMEINERGIDNKVLADKLAKRYYAIASSKFRSRRYHEAISAYQKVVELKPSSVASWLEMGKSYERLGLREDARGSWREALRYDENNGTVLALLNIHRGRPTMMAKRQQAKPVVKASIPKPARIAAVTKPIVIKKPTKVTRIAQITKPVKVTKVVSKPSKDVPALVADDSLAIVKSGKTNKGTRIDSALRSVVSLTKSLGTPVVEKGWEIKNRGEKFLVRYLCEQGVGAMEAFEWMVDVDSKRVSAHNDNARLLMNRW
jgi:tetratricopeptide (TPR) repeat protein